MNEMDDLGFALLDTSREKRTGYPETVYCEGKTVSQAEEIIRRMRERNIPVLGTRAGEELAKRILSQFPDAEWDELSRVLTVGSLFSADNRYGSVAVVAAGTSDLPVAREALLTARFFGSEVTLFTDVGVAGIHRLFAKLPEIRASNVIVAAAGMEGALASVLAGLVDVPVIALPTSIGYGANLGGLSALLGMLTSCAPGIATVNIDNGFGAGYMANMINRMAARQVAD